MADHYLQLSYRRGKLLAGYFYLDDPQARATRSQEMEAGMVVDFSEDGRPVGIEITSPSQFNLEALNRVLASLKLSPASAMDVAPLVAA